MNNFFQFSVKKATCLTRAEIKVSRIPRKRINLSIFVNFLKKKHFFILESFFFISFRSFEGVQYFLVDLFIFFSKLPFATNQQLFYVTETDMGQGPSNHTQPPYELLVSILSLTLNVGEVSKTCRRMHQKFRGLVPLSIYLHQIIFFFNFIFPALIGDPNNFEIVRLIRLVVSGMFLLPSSASLIYLFFLLHYDLISSKPSLNWTSF